MRRYKSLFEKTWVTIQNLSENLKLSDLTKNAGMSDFTLDFRKERNKIMGNEAQNAKLLDCLLDEKNDHVTFIWLTEVTPKDNEISKSEVDIKGNKKINQNRSKTYELKIRLLDFFSWLDTSPDKNIISSKDIKEIFEVSDIQLSSNDPSFQYQGVNYKLSLFDASIYPTTISDKIWGPRHNDNNLLTKHLGGLINGIKFWYSPMASMLSKRLKDKGII